VMTFPYSMGGSPSPAYMPFGLFESSPAAKSSSDEPVFGRGEVSQSRGWMLGVESIRETRAGEEHGGRGDAIAVLRCVCIYIYIYIYIYI
jgi:hypothetical protein